MVGRHFLGTKIHLPLSRACVLPTFAEYRLHRWYHEISYQQHGEDPKDILSYRSDPQINDTEYQFPNQSKVSICDNQQGELVRVEMLNAPWNPADVNTVQGRYPSPYESSPTPSIAIFRNRSYQNGVRVASGQCIGRHFENDPVIGSEGWGRVTHSGSSSVPPGRLVTLGLPGLGTLRSSLWVPASAVIPVPEYVREILGPAGCSLFQLGGTALRLLSDFVVTEPGDVVLQNAGNSGVGFLASQLAASTLRFGQIAENSDRNLTNSCPTPVMVSLIRRRGKSKESFDETVDYLTRVGKNAFVVAEEDFYHPEDITGKLNVTKGGRKYNKIAIYEMRQRLRDLSPNGTLPKLALNAVGGDSARLMLKLLEPNAGSTIVTYGGMSGKGIQFATPQLIFSDVRAVGYWHSRWMVREHEREQADRNRQVGGQTNGRIPFSNDPTNHRAAMVDLLSKLVKEEGLKCPSAHVVCLENLQEGLLWQENQSNFKDSNPSRRSPIREKLVWDCVEY